MDLHTMRIWATWEYRGGVMKASKQREDLAHGKRIPLQEHLRTLLATSTGMQRMRRMRLRSSLSASVSLPFSTREAILVRYSCLWSSRADSGPNRTLGNGRRDQQMKAQQGQAHSVLQLIWLYSTSR